MEATEKNYQIAEKIGVILEKESCTVAQAVDILAYVSRHIQCTSPVQFSKGSLAEVANTIN